MTEDRTNANTNAVPASKEAGEERLRGDISRILQEVKLPERRESRAQADVPAQSPKLADPIDTAVSNVAPREAPQIAGEKLSQTNTPPLPQQGVHESLSPISVMQSGLQALRTYKGDVEDLVRDRKTSLLHAVALESEKARKSEATAHSEEASPGRTARKKRRMSIGVAILTLIGIGLLAFAAVFIVDQQRNMDIAVPADEALMFSEQTFAVPMDSLNARELKLVLAQARDQASVTLGAITRLALTTFDYGENPNDPPVERVATAPEFLTAIDAKAPESLTRALGGDFFLGIHAIDRTVPVLIFTVHSYERAFAGMLEWEQAISDGLAPLYPAVLHETRDSEGKIKVSRFEDAVVRSFDARILKDRTGDVKILYSFLSRNILVIAESPFSIVEALSRLQAERKL